jgi:hypothetical protein
VGIISAFHLFFLKQVPTMARLAGHETPARVAVQTVYFAYGSNLHLAQMAKRCPESRYLGRGRLPNFKWQINTRGYANICVSQGDFVEGLCFLLSQKDEKRLDLNEGVPNSYQKNSFQVDVFAATATIAGRRVREVIETISQYPPPRQDQDHRNDSRGVNQQSTAQIPKYHSDTYEPVDALVYVNWSQTNEGFPKEEYISRINFGIKDAIRLGVPSDYFERYVREPMERRDPEERSFVGRVESRVQHARQRLVQPRRQVTDDRGMRRQNSRDGREREELDEVKDDINRSRRSRVEYNIVYAEPREAQVRSPSVGERGFPVADALHHSHREWVHQEATGGYIEGGREVEEDCSRSQSDTVVRVDYE